MRASSNYTAQTVDIPGDTGRHSRTANDFIDHGNGNNAVAARAPLRRMSGNVGRPSANCSRYRASSRQPAHPR